MCVGAQKVEKHNLTLKAHWNNGILARHNKIDAVLMISYANGPKGKCASLKYELRDDSPDPMYYPTRPAAMWTILLPLLQDFEEIIKSFKITELSILLLAYQIVQKLLYPTPQKIINKNLPKTKKHHNKQQLS